MIPKADIASCLRYCREQILNCGVIRDNDSWQGIKIPYQMLEAFEISFRVSIPDMETLKKVLKPNLPWADLQFEERVSGIPLNPGNSYRKWPYYGQDKNMRTEGDKFSHTYMERIWCKPYQGIRYHYGDLDDVIQLLRKDKYTRHAYLPIFFPEDTGKTHRIPCTLGYLFYFVGNFFHTTYYIRSCDYLRHLRDDIYLSIRLNKYILDKLSDFHKGIAPGYFTFHCANLHIFANEKSILEKDNFTEKNITYDVGTTREDRTVPSNS